MKLKEIVEKLHCSVQTGEDLLNQEVLGGYASDLLSDVIANSKAGDVWVTMQVHVNIVAVAVLKELAGIIIVQGRKPAEDTLRKAREEKIAVIVSDLSAFETVGKIHSMMEGRS
jgi:hypothetical protein